MSEFAPPALGVMFYDKDTSSLTPVVYVADVDSTYFEGSCASGTVAASFALVQDLEDGVHEFTMQQPEGMLHTAVTKKNGHIESISLKGLVSLSDIITVEIN
jgi:diaminopimelate epimerase